MACITSSGLGDFGTNKVRDMDRARFTGETLMTSKRFAMLVAILFGIITGVTAIAKETTSYVRYQQGNGVSYGILTDGKIEQLDGAPWNDGKRTGATVVLDDVTLLAPAEPSKVIAVGYNYISHRENMTHEENRPIPEYPPIFLKLPGRKPMSFIRKTPQTCITRVNLSSLLARQRARYPQRMLTNTCLVSRPAMTSASVPGRQMICNGFVQKAATISARWDRRSSPDCTTWICLCKPG